MEAVLARGEDEEANPFDISFALIEEEGRGGEEEDSGGRILGPSVEGGEEGAAKEMDGEALREGSSSGISRPASASLGGGDGRGGVGSQDDPGQAAEKPPLSLAAINARLEKYAMEHEWTHDGALADFGAVLDRQPSSVSVGRPPSAVHRSPDAAAPPRGGAAGPRSVTAGSTTTAAGQRDYLREARQVKELAERYGCLIRAGTRIMSPIHMFSRQASVKSQ